MVIHPLHQTTLPFVYKPLLEERDIYLANNILGIKGKKVVAVVGMAHMDGIERIWEEAQKNL